MANGLVSKPIAALFNGVSQQPSAIRDQTQCELLDNAYVTVAEGLRKRPPTKHIKKLWTGTPNNTKVHQVFRSATERYAVVVANGVCRAFDMVTGIEKTVDTATYPGVLGYLNSDFSIDDVGMLTVADTTFIWNRTKVVAPVAPSIVAQTPRLYVYVKEGRADSSYYINLLGSGLASVTVGNAPAAYNAQAVATGLAAAVAAISPFTCVRYGCLLVIARTDNAAFDFEINDSAGSSALMTGFRNRVERYSDLPREFVENATVEVRGAAEGAKTSFWVKFIRSSINTTQGHWEETVAPNVGEHTALDATTMPLALVRQPSGDFILTRPAWAQRLVGSAATTCPLPSFVGQTVSSVFFWRNRLGLLSDENVILTRSGNLFNFWPKSSTAVVDDDPIDVSVNAPRVSVLRHAVPFQRKLLAFADTAQFEFASDGALSPRTARCDVVTEYDSNKRAAPVSAGDNVFFSFERSEATGSYSGVREYYVNDTSSSNTAVDITAHVPQYIPRNVHKLAVSSTESILLALTTENWNHVYVHKFLWDGDKRVQSAWKRWVFFANDKILSVEVQGSIAYFVIQRSDGIHLETMDLQYGSSDIQMGVPDGLLDTPPSVPKPRDMLIHLDRKVEIVGTYNAGNNETSFVLPYAVDAGVGGVVEMVVKYSIGFIDKRGTRIPLYYKSGTTWACAGNWAATQYIGLQYTMRFRFSELFMRDRENNAITTGRLQLHYMGVQYRDSTYFRAEVWCQGREVARYENTAFRLGSYTFVSDNPLVASGNFRFPVASRSDRVLIDIVNDSPFPSVIYAARWEGLFANRSFAA